MLRREERVGESGKAIVVRSFAVTEAMSDPVRWRMVRGVGLTALPQLWNVACGRMSIVGPRPREPGFEAPPARPGLTGLAQLAQLERWLSVAEQLELDDRYAHTWSLGLDARIVWRTLTAVTAPSTAATVTPHGYASYGVPSCIPEAELAVALARRGSGGATGCAARP